MKTQTNFDRMGNKDINVYNDWLNSKCNEKCVYELCASVNEYCPYDATQIKYFPNGGFEMSYIELKGRNFEIDRYEDAIIDEYKILDLQRIAKQTKCKVYVVMLYYPSRKLAIWEIKPDTIYNTETIRCYWHTAAEDGIKKDKVMCKLPLKEAKKYRF